MSDDFLPFSRPSISQEAINDVVDCLKTGSISTGLRVAKFTENLKEYFDAPYVLPVNSGTAGLHLSLLAMDLQPGDEVITTPLTFPATLNAIVLAGAVPVLVDIHPQTYNMDPQQVYDAVTKRTRVILPVHFAGLPADLDAIYDIANHYGLRVIEDAAHAIGSEYKHKRIGSFGDTQVFSFHANKNMTTGEGGCVVTRDQKLAAQIARLRFHGIDREAWNRHEKNGSDDYEIVMPGFKYNMSDLQAAIGVHQLRELNHFIVRRTELAERYDEAMSEWKQWQLPQNATYDNLHSWHIYTPLINEETTGMHRDDFVRAMKDRNIGTAVHYRAAHLHPYYRQTFGFRLGNFPIAEDICERIVSLPLFPGMTDAEHDHVIDVMYHLFNDR